MKCLFTADFFKTTFFLIMTSTVKNFRCENTFQLRECTARIFKGTLSHLPHNTVKFLQVTTLYSLFKRQEWLLKVKPKFNFQVCTLNHPATVKFNLVTDIVFNWAVRKLMHLWHINLSHTDVLKGQHDAKTDPKLILPNWTVQQWWLFI